MVGQIRRCQKLPKVTTSCHKLLQVAKRWQKLWIVCSNVAWFDMVGRERLWSDQKKSAKIPGTGRDRDPNQHKYSEKFRGWFQYLFSVPNFFETNFETFYGTKLFWDRFRYSFRYQFFSIPVPILFTVPNYFETVSDTFFGTNFFQYRFRYFFRYQIFLIPVPIPSKKLKNSRDRDVTLW